MLPDEAARGSSGAAEWRHSNVPHWPRLERLLWRGRGRCGAECRREAAHCYARDNRRELCTIPLIYDPKRPSERGPKALGLEGPDPCAFGVRRATPATAKEQ